MINKKKKILIFPCGSEIGLEVHRALAYDKHFELFGASSLSDHGKYVFKNYIEEVPFVDDENFIEEINEICRQNEIDYIIPSHDSVVLKLAQNSEKLFAEVITSPVETCEIARSKSKTYKKLKDIIPVPKTYEITDKDINFPVFIKPDVGQGSKGAKKISNYEELNQAYKENNKIVICEYLPKEEYTVDCFTNYRGELIFAGGRIRSRILNGISANSKPVKDDKFLELAKKINSVLKFNGVWFFQVKKRENGEFVLMELAPRIAGTMGLYRSLGINFALLSLYNAMKEDIKIVQNSFNIETDRALFSRYKTDIAYEYVYIDLDDTIIVENKINIDIIKFLYQAKNQNKKIILITKHRENIKQTLKQYCICNDLFKEIIQIKENEEKSDYIIHSNAIFIDDSFVEREKVLNINNIPVFALDAVETIIDYRG